MKYTVHFAYDIPCVADIEIEADSQEQATDMARAMLQDWDNNDLTETSFDPVWDSCDNHRVMWILDEDDIIVDEGFGRTE